MAMIKIILERGDFRAFPQCCASCMTFENLEYAHVRSRTVPFFSRREEMEVPICARCARQKTWLHRLGIGLWIVVSFVGFSLLDLYRLPKYWSVVIGGGGIALLEVYLQGLAHGPVQLQRATRGRLTFLFTNEEYARHFEALNPSVQSPVPLIPVL